MDFDVVVAVDMTLDGMRAIAIAVQNVSLEIRSLSVAFVFESCENFF